MELLRPPFSYEALPPQDVNFQPLGCGDLPPMTGPEILAHFSNHAQLKVTSQIASLLASYAVSACLSLCLSVPLPLYIASHPYVSSSLALYVPTRRSFFSLYIYVYTLYMSLSLLSLSLFPTFLPMMSPCGCGLSAIPPDARGTGQALCPPGREGTGAVDASSDQLGLLSSHGGVQGRLHRLHLGREGTETQGDT